MVRRTLAALLALLAAIACTGGGDGLATPEATPSPPAATAASPTPTPDATSTVAPTASPTPTASPPTPVSPTPDATSTAAPTASPTPTATPPTPVSPTPDATSIEATPAASPTPEPRTAFGDGEWRVGVDIASGRYRASLASFDAECRWSTGSGRAGRTPEGAWHATTLVVIALSDRTFLSRGCREWKAHPEPSVTPGQPFGNGDYLVGVDIAPGIYRTTTATDHCIWRTGELVNIKEHPYSAMTIVDVRLSDLIFSTEHCGTWTTDLTPRITPGEPFGDGTWLVGSEVAPGRYRTTSDCAWHIRSHVDHPDSAFKGNIVDIDPADLWFASRGCEWTTDQMPRIAPGEPFGDGTWLVGSEVAPGLYVASDPANPGSPDSWERCRWAHLDDFRGGYRLSASAGLAAIVDIDPADAGFHSDRCGEWTPYAGPAVGPGQPFGDGVFLVGEEIAPGPYRTVAPPEGCRWERLREYGDSGYYGDYVGGAHQIANVAPTDIGFASRGCGAWEPVPIASFGDGEHRVGVDIPPGRYRTTAPTEDCEWERRDADGVTGFGGSSIPVAEVVLDLADLDRHPVFASSGCGTWTNDPTPGVAPGQSFGDGAWFVGPEVAPGRYRATGYSDSCRWQRLDGFRDRYDVEVRVMPMDGKPPNIAGWSDRSIAEIRTNDAAFVSRGCGTWAPLQQPIATPGDPFGDGAYILGLDIAPGRYRAYRATAPDGSLASCDWQRLSEWDLARPSTRNYGPSPPLANGGGSEGMAVLTVDIAESDVGFHSKGCGTWTTELTPAAMPGDPFGDGEWIVGLDIAPGRYRAHSPSDSCRWNRLHRFRGHSFVDVDEWGRLDVIEGSYGLDDPGEVAIASYDVGFASRDCGTWTPVPQ